MSLRKKKWWVAHTFDGSEFAIKAKCPSREDSWYGPFPSLKAAKADALAYHRATVQTARRAIYKINALRLSDFKGGK